MRYMTVALVLALSITLLSGCATGNIIKETEPITIGAILPLTGPAAEYGMHARQAIELAVQEINAAGGVNGRTVSVRFEDNQFEPRPTVNAFQRLMTQNIKYVIGYASPATLAACPLTEEYGAVLMSSGSNDAISACKHTYRNTPKNSAAAEIMAAFALDNNWKTAAILAVNSDYGHDVAKQLRETYEASGGQIVHSAFLDEDSRTQMTLIMEENPDVLFLVAGVTDEALRVFKYQREIGLTVPIIGSEALKDDSLFEHTVIDGLYVPFIAPNTWEQAERFTEAYKIQYGVAPGLYADYAYDNMQLLAQAMRGCAYTDTNCAEENLLEGEWRGATGIIRFDGKGDRLSQEFTMYTAKDGEFAVTT